MTEIRVLVVEGSAVLRRDLCELLEEDPGITIVGSSPSFTSAERRAEVTKPDIVVVGNSVREESDRVGSSFRSMGPTVDIGLRDISDTAAMQQLIEKIRSVAARRHVPPPPRPPEPKRARPEVSPAYFGSRLIAIGASAGGTEALGKILPTLEPPLPPILIVVHMPEAFTGRFAERLDTICQLSVAEAVDGDRIGANQIVIARGGWHLEVEHAGGGYQLVLNQAAPVKRHRPSVDTLMQSVAAQAAADGLGVILTGMGSDGAEGLLAMRLQGARTVAQDEETSAVYGMPRVATESGAAQHVVGLEEIPAFIHEWANTEEKVNK